METIPPAGDRPDPLVANLAFVAGEMVTDPERRTLPGGTELISFSLTVRRDGHATTSVPIVWYDPPKRVDRWKPGAQIAAVGPVVRRFYRAGGVTASRTEVNVERAELVSSSSRVHKLLAGYVDQVAQVTSLLE